MRLILLGPPGSGKGTQANLIKERYNLPHISTGDIFRQHISEKTALGLEVVTFIQKGLLVPDELTIRLVEDRLTHADCKNGFLLDGFPRTTFQSEALDSFLSALKTPLDLVLFLNTPMTLLLERNTGRRICSKCGVSYHTIFHPSKVSSQCDLCNGSLIQRKDDYEDTVMERLSVYESQTSPLIHHYKDKNLLVSIDGNAKINTVFEHICCVLDNYK